MRRDVDCATGSAYAADPPRAERRDESMPMKRPSVLIAATLIGAAAPAFARPSEPVWATDLVKVKPGELDHYVAFIRQNWEVARKDARAHHAILAYRVILVDKSAAGASAQPDVVLMTQYPDAAGFADREKTFAPILKRHPLVRVDGRTSRDFVESIEALSGTSPISG
jgi:hypothetical protein